MQAFRILERQVQVGPEEELSFMRLFFLLYRLPVQQVPKKERH
jgi:hypothetical protein